VRLVAFLVVLRAHYHGVEIAAFVRGSRVSVSEIVHPVRVRIGAARHAAFEGDTHKAGFKAVGEEFEAWNVGCRDGNGEDALRDDVVVDRVGIAHRGGMNVEETDDRRCNNDTLFDTAT
jgi:hypothetical protein